MTIWTPVLDRSKPLYIAIADAITLDVESGTLPIGTRLPPQRDLAWRIGVTLGTVTRAYKEAETRGLLTGEVGRGSFIKQAGKVRALPGMSPEADGVADLSHAIPPPVISQVEFDAAMSCVMREPRRLALLDYAPPEGFAHHRELGARWLVHSGIQADPGDVTVTAGAHVGFLTILGAIAEPREAVMAEQVNYALLGATLRNAYLEALPIEMDEEGLLPDAFERAARSGRSRILYLVPSLQNPTTNTMKRVRREAIVSIARKYNITIIEDDIFRLLDPRAQPSTFYALAPERTFYLTGLSKVLAPGLRMGFIVTPQGQNRVLKAHIRTAASRSIGITGEMARYWIESDLAMTILARIRNEFASRRSVFLDVFKGFEFRCEQAAPFAWLQLPERWSAGRFSTVLSGRGVKVTPGSAFEFGATRSSRFIRLCFGSPATVYGLRAALENVHALTQDQDDEDFTPVA
jgi:DNA-binding transcriptional MocR family regulator